MRRRFPASKDPSLTLLLALDVYSLVHRKALRLIGGHETALSFDANHEWPRLRNLSLTLDLMAGGDLKTEGLVTDVLDMDRALNAHAMLHDHPESHLGILIRWR